MVNKNSTQALLISLFKVSSLFTTTMLNEELVPDTRCKGCGIPSLRSPVKGKGKGFPYLIASVGPEADPSVQAVSLQVTISHPLGSRLPLLSARPAVTSPAAKHHRPLAGTKSSYTAW